MSGLPRKGTKYRLVHIELLVPQHAEMFMDVLSEFRDDNPDELVQWAQIPSSLHQHMTKEQAEEEWSRRHEETVTIEEYNDDE